MHVARLFRPLISAAALGCLLALPAFASADTVLTDDQIIQASLCVGTGCVLDESFSQQGIVAKRSDTPGLSMRQTPGAFTEYAWDVAGNEANFFVRDLTAGSRLPFRIRPNAVTSQVDLRANGVTELTGVGVQSSARTGATTDDGSTLLDALRNLTFQRYSVTGDTAVHLGPTEEAFNTAFGLGSNNKVAFTDAAFVALASVKALDARVSTLQMTPGPAGADGAAGPAGAPGAPASTAQLDAANRRIAALERTNKAQAKALVTLQKQMKQLLKKPRR